MAYPTPSGLSLVSNPAAQTHEQLTDEVADLRARLAEVSDTLDAIRGGEVDAVLVQGPQSSQLFTLKGADDPYRVLIEEMNQGAVTLSADGSILYCNRRFATLLRMPLDKIIGFAFESLVAPTERVEFAKLLTAGRAAGSAGEITLLASDSSPVPLQLAFGPLPANSAAKICLVATDISDRKRAERALRASEVSYRRLFEAAKDGILILDADTGRISDVNPFLLEMLGFSHGEMVGKSIWEISPFKDIVSNKVKFAQLQQQGYVRYENLPLETRDGRYIAVEFVSTVYPAGDRSVIQCNIRDITERKHAAEELRASGRRFSDMLRQE